MCSMTPVWSSRATIRQCHQHRSGGVRRLQQPHGDHREYATIPAFSSVDGILFNKSQTAIVQYPPGKIGNYTIPNSVTNLEAMAFFGCGGLSSVTITNGLTSVGVMSSTAHRPDQRHPRSQRHQHGGLLRSAPARAWTNVRSPTASPASGTKRRLTTPP